MQKKSLLPSAWQVPEIFRDRLGARAGRQRAMFHDGHLLLVLHESPGPDEQVRRGSFFWRKPDGAWASTTRAAGHNALEAHLDEYDKILNDLDEQEDTASSADDYFELMRRLNPLVRASRNLHSVLQQARKMVPGDKRIINYRDRAYGIERRAELLVGDTKNALDYTIARQSEAQAKSSQRMAVSAHRLNILVAFFFPVATLSAIFGVNLKHGLEPERVDALWPLAIVLGTGLLLGILLTGFVTRKSE